MNAQRTRERVIPLLFIGGFLASCGQGNRTSAPPEPLVEAVETSDTEAMAVDADVEDPDGPLSDTRPTRHLSRDGVNYVASNSPELPRVRFADGQLGISESCAIKLGNKLSRQVPPAYVNGQPLGFC